MKRVLTALIAIVAVIGIAVVVYSHCHDTYLCEQVQSRLVGPHYWSGFHIPVDWWINPTYPNMPSLSDDVSAVADLWDGPRRSDGSRIPFFLRSGGITTAESHDRDDTNVVSWIGLENSPHLAETAIWLIGDIGPLIDEADIGFNYYKPWKKHANPTSGYYCIRDTAAHEFGHFAGLLHV